MLAMPIRVHLKGARGLNDGKVITRSSDELQTDR
jgi:hypothetical protein